MSKALPLPNCGDGRGGKRPIRGSAGWLLRGTGAKEEQTTSVRWIAGWMSPQLTRWIVPLRHLKT